MGPRLAPWRSLGRVPRPPGVIEDPRSLLPKGPGTASASLGARAPPQRGPPLASHAADPSAPRRSTASQVTLARGALLLSRWPFLSVQLAATTDPRVQSPGCSQALLPEPCLPIATASCRAWHAEGLSPACWSLHAGHQTPPPHALPGAAGEHWPRQSGLRAWMLPHE